MPIFHCIGGRFEKVVKSQECISEQHSTDVGAASSQFYFEDLASDAETCMSGHFLDSVGRC